MRERATLTQTFLQACALMTRFAPSPVSVCARRIFTRASQHTSTFVYTRIVGVEEECFERRARRSLERLYHTLPRFDERCIARFARKQVHTRTRVRNVEPLRVHAHETRVVALVFKLLLHLIPRRVAHVLQDDDRWLALSDPVHHPAERLTRLPLCLETLTLVVQVGVIDTRSTRDEHVDVVRHVDFRAVSRRRLVAA